MINNTTNITNINVTNNYGTAGGAAGAGRFRGVSTGGPALAEVNAHSHTPVQTVQLTAASQPGRSTLNGNALAVYAPRVNAATLHTAKPATVARTIAHPTLNRGTSITKPLAVNASLKPAAPTAEAIAAAKEARAHAPATAKIATSTTHVKTPLTKPLTAMVPVNQVKHTTSPTETHTTASSPFTGEAQKPAVTYHPETEAKPETTYHPEAAPAPTYHPQAQSPSTETYHPQTEEKPAATYHPQSETPPAPAYHPQSEPQHESTPAPSFHPQAEAQHEPAPASHPQPAAKSAPAPGGGGNKSSDGKNDNQQPGH